LKSKFPKQTETQLIKFSKSLDGKCIPTYVPISQDIPGPCLSVQIQVLLAVLQTDHETPPLFYFISVSPWVLNSFLAYREEAKKERAGEVRMQSKHPNKERSITWEI